jgi:hypothetical protein
MPAPAPTLPLFGHAPPTHGSPTAMRDLRAREEMVLDWHGKGAHWVEISVARDALGAWWVSQGWSLSADLGRQTGAVGAMSPFWSWHATREAAIAAGAHKIAEQLPPYTGAAGRQVRQIRAQLAPFLAPDA